MVIEEEGGVIIARGLGARVAGVGTLDCDAASGNALSKNAAGRKGRDK